MENVTPPLQNATLIVKLMSYASIKKYIILVFLMALSQNTSCMAQSKRRGGLMRTLVREVRTAVIEGKKLETRAVYFSSIVQGNTSQHQREVAI